LVLTVTIYGAPFAVILLVCIGGNIMRESGSAVMAPDPAAGVDGPEWHSGQRSGRRA
jgi:hypothetical protein